MSIKNVLIGFFAVFAFQPQEAPKPETKPATRSLPGQVDPRTPYADIMGTVHVSSTDLFGGGWMGLNGNPTFLIDVANDDPKLTLESLEGFVGFAPGAKNKVIQVKAKALKKTGPDTWEADPPTVGSQIQSEVDHHGVISITKLNLAPGDRVQIVVDSARRDDEPIAFGFKVKYL
jgi:hypothetical protein